MKHKETQDFAEDVKAAASLSDYEAVDVLWVAMVKAANRLPGKNEHQRMLALVDSLTITEIRACLKLSGVETLIHLDPPLETILADVNERLESEKTSESFNKAGNLRYSNPKAAFIELGEVLKRIRNKRAHGFKSRGLRRDSEILGAAKQILNRLCETVIAQLMRD